MINILKTIDPSKKLYTIKYFSKNSIIFNESQPCLQLCIIEKGKVKISTYNLNGEEFNIKFLNAFDSFGGSLLFANNNNNNNITCNNNIACNNNYMGNVIALEDSVLYMISLNNLFILLKNDDFLHLFLQDMAQTNIKNQNKIKILSQKTIEDKILFFLKLEQIHTHSNVIYISSKEHLALLLNVPRPSLSRSLMVLKQKGIIDYNKKTITIKEVFS